MIDDDIGIEKPTENWTRFPNSILDNLDQFEPNEFKVLAFVIRKNLGWRDRANRRFAVRYVAARLNMADRTAWAAIQGLEKKGLIHCIDRERSGLRLYEVTWRTPKKSRRVRAVAKNATRQNNGRIAKNATEPLQKMHTVLETRVLETSNADALPMLPSTFEHSKTKNKSKNIIPKDIEEKTKPAFALLSELIGTKIAKAYKTKNMSERIAAAIDEHGVETVADAIRGRVIIKRGQDLALKWLFEGDGDFAAALRIQEAQQRKTGSMWHSPQTSDTVTIDDLPKFDVA